MEHQQQPTEKQNAAGAYPGSGSRNWAFGMFDCFAPVSTCTTIQEIQI
jgi:hypothetical protein